MGSSGSKQTIGITDQDFPWKIKPPDKDFIYDDDAEEYEREEQGTDEDDDDYDDDGNDVRFENCARDFHIKKEDEMSMNSNDTLFLTKELSEYCGNYSSVVPDKYRSVLDFMKDYVGYERPPRLTWEEKRDRALKFVEERENEWLNKRDKLIKE